MDNSDYIRQTMEMDQSNYIGGQTMEENMEHEDEHHQMHAMTSIVRLQSGDQLLVSACGRTCSVDMHYARSLVDLQGELQRKLQMDGQIFHICDINGALLSTDMQVSDAIEQGLTPLCATLPDKSLHHLENRREELAQMQWKLVRDQMSNSTNQLAQLTRQFNEVQFQVQAQSRETTHTLEQMRMEAQKATDKERATTKAELAPLHEAVNGAVLLINGERSKRELSVQGFEKHIHGVCDMLDGERASRRQDLAMHMSVMQELRVSLDAERNSRADLEQVVAELKESTSRFQDEMKATLREQQETLSRVQSDIGTSISDHTGAKQAVLRRQDNSPSIEAAPIDTKTVKKHAHAIQVQAHPDGAITYVRSVALNSDLHHEKLNTLVRKGISEQVNLIEVDSSGVHAIQEKCTPYALLTSQTRRQQAVRIR